MEYVRLGRTGLQVSRICLGTMTYGSPTWRDWVLPEDASRPIIKRALELAGEKGVKPAQIALAWLLHRPGVSAPVIGASKTSQLEEAVEALSVKLSPEESAYLEELYVPRPVLEYE